MKAKKSEDPVGTCPTCKQPIWNEHDHRPIRTLSQLEASAYWSPDAVRERDAAQSRQ